MLRVLQIVEGAPDIRCCVELMVKAMFTNFLVGMKRSELCTKKDLPIHEIGKFLSDCDYSGHYPSSRKDSTFAYRRSFSSGRPLQVEPTTTPPYNSNNNVDSKFVHNKEVKSEYIARKNPGSFNDPITCHNCGEPGHIRPNCLKLKPKNAGRDSD